MKKTLRKIIASLLAAVMFITAAPLGGLVGLNLDSFDFGSKASAESVPSFNVKQTAKDGNKITVAVDLTSGTFNAMDFQFVISEDVICTSISVVDKLGMGERKTGRVSIVSLDGFTGGTIITATFIVPLYGDYRISGSASSCAVTSDGVNNQVVPRISEAAEGGSYNYSLKCGEKAYYYFDNQTGFMTIYGTGDMYDYESFDDSPFYDYKIKGVVIYSGITSIGVNAFYSYSELDDIFYYGTEEQWDSIKNSDKIDKSLIHSNAGRCGEKVFYGFNSDGVLTIGGAGEACTSSFYQPLAFNASIKSAVVKSGVTSIGNYIFSGCTGLENITIPDSITSICDCAFYGCTSLTSITIPDSVTSIGDWAFYNCISLTSIIIPNCVTSIGDRAFYYCTSLTSIIIPNSITNIGEGAVASCSDLANIIVSAENKKYDSRNNCNAIIETSTNTLIAGCKNTVIPNSITSIGNYAFDSCRNLASITIPDSVTSIGDEAFAQCSLTSITIPDSVTRIGYCAFLGCRNLKELYIGKNVASIGEDAFYQCYGLSIVTVASEKFSGSLSSFGFSPDGYLDDVMLVANKKNTDAINYANDNKIPVVTFSYSEVDKQLRFDGNTVVYEDLEYNYLPELVKGYPDAEKLYFKRLEFDGVEPEMLELDLDVFEIEIDDNIETDKESENLAYNNLYVDFSVIRDGKEEKVSFGKIFEFLESGDYDSFKMRLSSNEEVTEQTFFEKIVQAIETFFEDAIRVITKVINFVASIFKKK